jgi:hypothetical protein
MLFGNPKAKTSALRDRQLQLKMQFSDWFEMLAKQVTQRQITLVDALALGVSWLRQEPELFSYLELVFPDCSEEERLAINVMSRILKAGPPPAPRREALAHELADSYASCYGQRVPNVWWDVYRRDHGRAHDEPAAAVPLPGTENGAAQSRTADGSAATGLRRSSTSAERSGPVRGGAGE